MRLPNTTELIDTAQVYGISPAGRGGNNITKNHCLEDEICTIRRTCSNHEIFIRDLVFRSVIQDVENG